jgi:hypothetical protein
MHAATPPNPVARSLHYSELIKTPTAQPMLTLATLRRTLYALLSVRFIELQKQRRRP